MKNPAFNGGAGTTQHRSMASNQQERLYMKKRNNKVSTLLPGEFYCPKCNEYMKKAMKHNNKLPHCKNCQKKVVAALVVTKDKVKEVANVDVLHARDVTKGMADIKLELELKRINGNHLADYL